MTTLLGTQLKMGKPSERAVLISDLHVGSDGGSVLGSLDAAIAVARQSADALFVLGRWLSHETGAGDNVWVPNVPTKSGID